MTAGDDTPPPLATRVRLRLALTDVVAMLSDLRDQVQDIEAADDGTAKRAIIEQLVNSITVHSEGEGRRKQATVVIA